MSNRFLPPLLIAAAAFLVFVLLVPQYDRIKLISDDTKAQEKFLVQKKKILDSIKNISQEVNDRRSDINKLNELIPDKNGTPEIISGLTSIAGQAGLLLTDFSFSEVPESEAGTYRSMLINLKLSGSYIGLKNFLNLLEQSQRLFDAIRVNVNQTPGSNQLSISINLKAYFISSK